MKQTTFIVLAAALALAAGIGARHLNSNSLQTSQTPLPEFNLPDLAGQSHSIREWQGKILVINFWATWCTPCLKEIPELIELQKTYADKNLTVIGIAIDDPDEVKQFIATNPINYPILLTKEDGVLLTRKLGNQVDAIPFTAIVDQQGQIIYQHPGGVTKQELLDVITPLLK